MYFQEEQICSETVSTDDFLENDLWWNEIDIPRNEFGEISFSELLFPINFEKRTFYQEVFKTKLKPSPRHTKSLNRMLSRISNFFSILYKKETLVDYNEEKSWWDEQIESVSDEYSFYLAGKNIF